MTDIFLSYKREDEARVARLAQALERAGFSVWWDRTGLAAGADWRAAIETALAAAKLVIVVWTRASAGPEGGFVHDEAGRAKDKLVPVFLDRVKPPLGFGAVQGVDLAHWRGSDQDPSFQDLLATLRARLIGAPPPPLRGPLARLRRRLFTWGGAGGALTATALAFAINVLGVQQTLCTLPIGQPALADACGAAGLGDQPTRAAREAFAALPPGDCAALQTFRDRFESSPLRTLADSRLAARRLEAIDWRPVEMTPALVQPGDPYQDEVRAVNAAMAAAQGQAERLCRTYESAGRHRLQSAAPRADVWACEARAGGVACTLEGVAVCKMLAREERYRCG